MDKINLAVVGAGYWGPNHIRTFNNLPNSAVTTVVDLDAARLERISAMYPGTACVTDYRQVLADSQIRAIVISTPTSTHYAVAREAIRAGKHILCEKPLCESAVQAEELVALANECHVVLMTGHIFLFNAGILKLKETIDSGALGRLQYLSAARTNLGPIRSDVNAAYDLATHDISIFNWLLGCPPESASATGASFIRPGVEDVVFISLKYPGGAIGSITASWLDPKKVRQITAVGNKGMATWDDLQPATPVAIYDKGVNVTQEYNDYGEFLRLSMWEGDVRLPKVRTDEPLKVQAQEFLKYVQTGRVEKSDAAFSLGVVKTLDAVTASMRQGGSPVTLRP